MATWIAVRCIDRLWYISSDVSLYIVLNLALHTHMMYCFWSPWYPLNQCAHQWWNCHVFLYNMRYKISKDVLKIKNETTDDDCPLDVVSVPQPRVYGGGQKEVGCIIDLDSQDPDDAYQIHKGEDDRSLRKILLRYRFCVHQHNTTARLLFTN